MDKMKPQDSCLLSVLQARTLLLCRGELLGATGAVQGSKTHGKKNGSSGYPKGEFGTLPCAAGYGFKLQ